MGGQVATFQNNNNRRLERSISSQEVPQRLTFASTYELPFGNGKAFLEGLPAVPNWIVSGWQVNGILTLQGGIPLVLTTAVNNTNSFGGGSRPNTNGSSAKLEGATVERINRYFDTSTFSLPEPFKFGNVSRTPPDVRAPGVVNTDLFVF